MKVIVVTRFDFTAGRKDGGLEIAYRNCHLIESIYGKENVTICIITANKHENKDNIKYFHTHDNIVFNYYNYLLLRDKISRKLEKEIVDYIDTEAPDVVFFDGSTFGQFTKKIECKFKSVIYFQNIERQYTWDQVKKYSWLCIFRYIANRVNEKKMLEITNNYICMNKRDEALLYKYYGVRPNFIFPATFDDTYTPGEADGTVCNKEGLNLLFVGSYFAHNYKGLIWFIKEVLPDLNAHLTVVGKNMEKLATKVSSEKLTIDGTVEDLVPYYRNADAIVMPIFMGGGMKVKTAEALMYGKTLFASPESLVGYNVNNVDNVFCCNSKEHFVKYINEYGTRGSKKKFNENIREVFLKEYCTDTYKESFKKYMLETITQE